MCDIIHRSSFLVMSRFLPPTLSVSAVSLQSDSSNSLSLERSGKNSDVGVCVIHSIDGKIERG